MSSLTSHAGGSCRDLAHVVAPFGALLGASGVYCYKVSVVVRRRVETRITARENGAPDARTQPRAPPTPKCPNPYPRSSLGNDRIGEREIRVPAD